MQHIHSHSPTHAHWYAGNYQAGVFPILFHRRPSTPPSHSDRPVTETQTADVLGNDDCPRMSQLGACKCVFYPVPDRVDASLGPWRCPHAPVPRSQQIKLLKLLQSKGGGRKGKPPALCNREQTLYARVPRVPSGLTRPPRSWLAGSRGKMPRRNTKCFLFVCLNRCNSLARSLPRE